MEGEAEALQARGASLAAARARLASTLDLLGGPSRMGDDDKLGLLQLCAAAQGWGWGDWACCSCGRWRGAGLGRVGCEFVWWGDEGGVLRARCMSAPWCAAT